MPLASIMLAFDKAVQQASHRTVRCHSERPLPVAFRHFQIHPEFHTLVWANGADIAPEFLHDNVRVTA